MCGGRGGRIRGQGRIGRCGREGRRRRQRYCKGQRNSGGLSAGVAHGHFDFVLAVPQLLGWNREDVVADDLARPVVKCDFDLGDVRLSAGADFDIAGRLQDGVSRDAAEFHGRRQGGNFKLQRLDDFGAGGIDRAQGNRVRSWRQLGGIQGELHAVVFNDNGQARVGADGGDRRLAGCQDSANDGVADDCVFGQPFDLQAWGNDLHIEFTVYGRTLTAGVGGADAERMLAGAQFKGIEIELVGRLLINFEELAIDEKLDLGDLGLAAGIHPNHFDITDFGPGRRLEIVGYGGRQGRDLKFCCEPADVAFDIADGDIQPVFAGGFLGRFNGVSLVSRDDFAIERDLDAFDVLVGQDLDLDLGIFAQGLGKNIVGQE